MTADLRTRGALNPPTLGTGEGMRAAAERAMASVIDSASSVRSHPDLGTDPKLLAGLIPADDAKTVTVPKPFLRWDPIIAPTFVPRVAYTTGESLQRMVIRTGLTGTPGACERHVVPPKGSELEAEQDGRLDQLMKAGNIARAYAIALKERGSLFYEKIQDLDNPKGTIVQPGIALLSMPNVTKPVTLGDIQDPEVQPAAGQYIVHDVDDLLIPYLPDPMVSGVALVFYEAGADHRSPILVCCNRSRFPTRARGRSCSRCGWCCTALRGSMRDRTATSSTSGCPPVSRSRSRSPPHWTMRTCTRWASG